jgi:hypothetical protein
VLECAFSGLELASQGKRFRARSLAGLTLRRELIGSLDGTLNSEILASTTQESGGGAWSGTSKSLHDDVFGNPQWG